MTHARICTAITARPRRRARRAALTAGLLAAAVLCVGPRIAVAAQTRELIRQFGSMSNPLGSAIDQSSGDLYVADTGNNRVVKFSADGAFELAFGADVGGAGVNTCTSGCQPGTSGSAPGQFTTAQFVAVDNAPSSVSYHDVYVADPGDGLVSKFDAAGNLISSWGTGGQLSGFGSGTGSIAGVAVDSGGNLVVLQGLGSTEYVFSQSGAPISQTALPGVTGTIPNGIAVDPAEDLFTINGGGNVEEFTSARADVGQVTTGTNAASIAVDPTTNDLYVETRNTIDHYAFDGSGSVIEPGGGSCALAPNQGCGPTDSTPFGFAGSSGGLAVDSATGDIYATQPGLGQIWEYGPLVTVPDVGTGSASNVSSTGATVSGTVAPDGVALTDCHFDYGPTTAYGQSVPCQDSSGNSLVGNSSTTPVAVHADVTGLESGTAYHFRLVAGNANGSVQGDDAAFGTAAAGFGVKSFSFSVTDQAGNPYTQAGGHPYALTADLHFNTQVDQSLNVEPDENVKDVRVDLPPGLIANPAAAPKCAQADFVASAYFTNCPADTQVGVITFDYTTTSGILTSARYPVYNLVAPDGVPAQFGFQLIGIPTFVDGAVRTGADYGLSSTTSNITQAEPVVGTTLTLWGDPADPSHDPDRACPGFQPPGVSGVNCPSSAPPAAFLTMPTSCPGTHSPRRSRPTRGSTRGASSPPTRPARRPPGAGRCRSGRRSRSGPTPARPTLPLGWRSICTRHRMG